MIAPEDETKILTRAYVPEQIMSLMALISKAYDGGPVQFLWWKEKPLRTLWRVEKESRSLYLVGTAHFFPYRFKEPLTKLIQDAEIVVFEGPLDQENMTKVVEYGRRGEDTPSIYGALRPEVIEEINKELRSQLNPSTSAGSYLDLLRPSGSNYLETLTKGVRPWLAFFMIWAALLNWRYSMDVEAFHISLELGRKIRYLETVDDQLAALDGIPFERFVHYLNHIEHWKGYKELFLKAFLEGDLEKFASLTSVFPTRCESILSKRDVIFFEGMKSSFEEGKTAAFVGVAHIPGIRKLFLDEGYEVIQEEA